MIVMVQEMAKYLSGGSKPWDSRLEFRGDKERVKHPSNLKYDYNETVLQCSSANEDGKMIVDMQWG